jgi:hypothetical protein
MTILSFVLTSQKEIVGEVVEETEDAFKVKHPVSVFAYPGQSGGMTVTFAPLSWAGDVKRLPDQTLIVNKCQISLGPIPVNRDLENNYLSATSSLHVASASITSIDGKRLQ